MSTIKLRKQLHRQIDHLPDEIVEQIADFTQFVMSKKNIPPIYTDWNHTQWQEFALEQFFREDDELQYSLEDAIEIFHP